MSAHRVLGEAVLLRPQIPPDVWTIVAGPPNKLESARPNLALTAREVMPAGGALTADIEQQRRSLCR